MHVTRHLIILFVIALVLPAVADSDVNALRQSNTSELRLRGMDRAMMVRDRELPMSRESTADLLLFCRQKGVTAIFVASYELPPSTFFEHERVYRWRTMIREAHRQGLLVFASAGNASWVSDRGRALAQLDAVAQLGQEGSPGEGFDGVLFEFPSLSQLQRLLPAATGRRPAESAALRDGDDNRSMGSSAGSLGPDVGANAERDVARPDAKDLYPQPEVATASNMLAASLEDRELLRQHLEIVDYLKRYAAQRYPDLRLRIGVSVPAWLQVPVGYGAEVKFAVDHFIDRSDFVVLHNLPGETTSIGEAADQALRYAGEAGKSAYLRIELGYPVREQPQLISLFHYDELFLESLVLDLVQRHGGTPGLAGVLLDDYRSYQRLPAERALPGFYTRPEATQPDERFRSRPWRRIESRQGTR